MRESHRKHTSTYRHSFGSLGTISRVESYRVFLCCSCLVTCIPSSENVRPRKGSWRDWLRGEVSEKSNAGGAREPLLGGMSQGLAKGARLQVPRAIRQKQGGAVPNEQDWK